MKKFHKGFTLVEIMIVVAIIGLLVAIALPNFMVARRKSQMNTCKANLKQIDGAISQCLLETNITTLVMADMVPTYIKAEPRCPAQLTIAYTILNNASGTCSYVDAEYKHLL